MNETIGSILIGIGVAFDLLGCVGLVRLPDVYNRLQAATKCITLGTCLILAGVAVSAGWDNQPLMIKSLLCAAFIALTSPVGAHALARGAYRSGIALWEGSVVDEYAQSEAMARYKTTSGTTAPPLIPPQAGERAAGQEQEHAKAETT